MSPLAYGATTRATTKAGESMTGMGSAQGSITWIIIAAVIAVIGGIVLYFTFLSKKNEGKFKGFLGWAYEFFNFKKFTIDAFLRIIYLILAIFITLASFSVINLSFGGFLAILLGGNLVLRIIFEFSLIVLVICRNIIDINNKLTKKEE